MCAALARERLSRKLQGDQETAMVSIRLPGADLAAIRERAERRGTWTIVSLGSPGGSGSHRSWCGLSGWSDRRPVARRRPQGDRGPLCSLHPAPPAVLVTAYRPDPDRWE